MFRSSKAPKAYRAPSTGYSTVLLAAVLLAASCGGSEGMPSDRTRLLVSAASSLTDVFGEIEARFEESAPGVDVVLNLGASSLLREQIFSGAPAGVYASASPDIMRQVDEAGYLDGPFRVFARSRLAIVVPRGNPAGIAKLEDLGRDALLVGLCAEGAPCGYFARRALAKAGVAPAVDTEEPNVRALLTKVEEAEIDAAVVYATDIAAAEGVEGIPIPDPYNVMVEYLIAVVEGAPAPEAAADFAAFVLSAEGGRILERHGFSLP